MSKVAILMGSDSDLGVMQKAIDRLRSLEIGFEVRVLSAHRTPEACAKFCREAEDNGFGAIIAAAGKAAHLAGAAGGQHGAAGHRRAGEVLDAGRAGRAAVHGADAFGHPGGHGGHRRRGQRGHSGGADSRRIGRARCAGRLKAMRREMTEAVEAKDRKIRRTVCLIPTF